MSQRVKRKGLYLLSLSSRLPFSSALQSHFFPQPPFPLSGLQNTPPRPAPQLPRGQVSLLSHHLPTQLLCASGEQSRKRINTVGGAALILGLCCWVGSAQSGGQRSGGIVGIGGLGRCSRIRLLISEYFITFTTILETQLRAELLNIELPTVKATFVLSGSLLAIHSEPTLPLVANGSIKPHVLAVHVPWWLRLPVKVGILKGLPL